MNKTGLANYDAMVTAISVCHKVDEVKVIRDKAMALEKYAQLAMNTDAERRAMDIRLRAERRAGELLQKMNKAKGGQPHQKATSNAALPVEQTLADLGITKNQSSKWQRLADVPKDDFESALADPLARPSTNSILKKVSGDDGNMNPNALWIWGRLRDMEGRNLFNEDTDFLTGEVTQAMLDDFRRLVPNAIAFLKNLEESCYE